MAGPAAFLNLSPWEARGSGEPFSCRVTTQKQLNNQKAADVMSAMKLTKACSRRCHRQRELWHPDIHRDRRPIGLAGRRRDGRLPRRRQHAAVGDLAESQEHFDFFTVDVEGAWPAIPMRSFVARGRPSPTRSDLPAHRPPAAPVVCRRAAQQIVVTILSLDQAIYDVLAINAASASRSWAVCRSPGPSAVCGWQRSSTAPGSASPPSTRSARVFGMVVAGRIVTRVMLPS